MTHRLTTFDDLSVGQATTFTRTISDLDIRTFVELCGDANPIHVDDAFAERTFFKGRIAHGLLTASLLSTAIGMKLPGTGAIYRSQTLEFLKPVRPGDTLTTRLEVEALDPKANEIALDCKIEREDGTAILRGKAVVSLIRNLDP